jgi:hypothetical protein
MASTILQDKHGWFWRDERDGTATSLSDPNPDLRVRYPFDVIKRPVVLVQDGQPTGFGDPLAERVALHCVDKGVW